jgi:hypothetical protein
VCTQVAQVVRLVQAAMAYNGSHFYHCKMLTPVLASTAGFVAARRPYGVADRKSIAPARAAGRGQHRGAAAAERRAVLQRRAVPRHPCGAGGLRGRLLGSIRRVAAGAHRVRRLEVAVRCGGCGGPGGCTHNVSGWHRTEYLDRAVCLCIAESAVHHLCCKALDLLLSQSCCVRSLQCLAWSCTCS